MRWFFPLPQPGLLQEPTASWQRAQCRAREGRTAGSEPGGPHAGRGWVANRRAGGSGEAYQGGRRVLLRLWCRGPPAPPQPYECRTRPGSLLRDVHRGRAQRCGTGRARERKGTGAGAHRPRRCLWPGQRAGSSSRIAPPPTPPVRAVAQQVVPHRDATTVTRPSYAPAGCAPTHSPKQRHAGCTSPVIPPDTHCSAATRPAHHDVCHPRTQFRHHPSTKPTTAPTPPPPHREGCFTCGISQREGASGGRSPISLCAGAGSVRSALPS